MSRSEQECPHGQKSLKIGSKSNRIFETVRLKAHCKDGTLRVEIED